MTQALARARREHMDALAGMLDRLGEVGVERWDEPVAPDRWSPAQIARHLTLTYRSVTRDLEGGDAPRPRVGSGWQRLFRMIVLPHILFHRSFPVRVRAPREWRPEAELPPRAANIEEMEAAARAFDARAAAAAEDGRAVRHPYFGEVDAVRALRLAAVHLEHHRRHVIACLAQRRPAGAGTEV